jgi:hypothetical protein
MKVPIPELLHLRLHLRLHPLVVRDESMEDIHLMLSYPERPAQNLDLRLELGDSLHRRK